MTLQLKTLRLKLVEQKDLGTDYLSDFLELLFAEPHGAPDCLPYFPLLEEKQILLVHVTIISGLSNPIPNGTRIISLCHWPWRLH